MSSKAQDMTCICGHAKESHPRPGAVVAFVSGACMVSGCACQRYVLGQVPDCGCGQGLTFGNMCPECFTKGRPIDTELAHHPAQKGTKHPQDTQTK